MPAPITRMRLPPIAGLIVVDDIGTRTIPNSLSV
jgi:hypothetical protein